MFRLGIMSVYTDRSARRGVDRVAVRFFCGCWRTFERLSSLRHDGWRSSWFPQADFGAHLVCSEHHNPCRGLPLLAAAALWPDAAPSQDNAPDMAALAKLIFRNEDTLSEFVRAINAHEAAALDAMLYGRGVKYDPDAIRRWERSL